MSDELKLIFTDRWIVARRTKSDAFEVHGRTKWLTAPHVWADPETTAFICQVGEERAVHDLPPAPSPGTHE